METSGIYCWRNTINEKRYVGSSSNMGKRKSQHKCALKKNHHNNPHLQSAWNFHGEDAFVFEVLEYVEKSLLAERELFYFNKYDVLNREKGYNIRQDPERRIFSEETRKKISLAKKGVKQTKEHIANMVRAITGKTRTQETKDKMSRSALGKKFTETHRSNISKAKKGKQVVTPEQREKMSERTRNRWQKLKESGYSGEGFPKTFNDCNS